MDALRTFVRGLQRLVPAHVLAPLLALLLTACGGGSGGASSGSSGALAAPTMSPPAPVAPTVSMGLAPSSIYVGQSATLTWSSTNATTCTAAQSPAGPFSGALAASGSETATPAAVGTYRYQVLCNNSGGYATASVVLTAATPPAPSVTLSVSPPSVVVGQPSILTWGSTYATSCTASESASAGGFTSGAVGTSGVQAVYPSATGTYSYTVACSGLGGSDQAVAAVLVVPPGTSNAVPVTVDNGPAGGRGSFNVPYVTVTVCAPATPNCQTVDHVLLDTGSYGLRLLSSTLGSLALPPVTSGSVGMAECAQFASGFTWGSVRKADIQIGAEVAPAVPIQVIGDPTYATVPLDCMSTGRGMDSVAALGSNGILGVGAGLQDCPACSVVAIPATYYTCPLGNCANSMAALTQQVINPVGAFATDNNGVVLQLPAVGQSGASNAAGTLIFGIGTQSNNGLGLAVVYTMDTTLNFTTTFNGTTNTASFLDSGSNGLFFADASLPFCSSGSGFYCPPTPVNLTATNTGMNSATSQINFTIVGFNAFAPGTTAGPVGGGGFTLIPGQTTFDWGLPFFFGRSVYTAIEGAATPGGPGPYWAY